VEATGMNRYKVMKFIILLEGRPEFIAVRSGDPTGSANGIAVPTPRLVVIFPSKIADIAL